MLSALLILFVTSLIVLDVLGRGLFNKPLTGTVEIVSNIIVVIAFLQISYSIQTNGMFHTDMFVNLLPEGLKKFVRLLGELAGAALLGMMIYASWEPMLHSWSIGEYFGGGQFRFPVYPVRTVVVFCCCLAFLNYLLRAFDAVTGSNSSVSQEEL
ncbi:TRAP-type C4-dicarboxylate transport system, small permease component [Pseudovibrio denitrificans]|uniref:TRAP transporter small permease protein n=1 Tax=Pseudovibrio denitrificans TaxID=258256 RepID=A0A1I7DSK8_9HYPH|nr:MULTISPECIES: TRAP transporter small permease [Pseudovibrio]EEA94690.1 TRAP transporter, DctQ-like membrane protein [Pseudovibrio sp. JE062]SFU14691.1 TRAP-type C4-dicarboxylate transport system, small permease component [Pseudovibrio denitrificans]